MHGATTCRDYNNWTASCNLKWGGRRELEGLSRQKLTFRANRSLIGWWAVAHPAAAAEPAMEDLAAGPGSGVEMPSKWVHNVCLSCTLLFFLGALKQKLNQIISKLCGAYWNGDMWPYGLNFSLTKHFN